MCEDLAVDTAIRLDELNVQICVQRVGHVKVDRDKVVEERINSEEDIDVREDLRHVQSGQARRDLQSFHRFDE